MKPKFISSTGSSKKHTMLTKSDNVEIIIGNDTDKTIQELFDSVLNRYQEWLNQSMVGSNLVFDNVNGFQKLQDKPQMWWIIYRFP